MTTTPNTEALALTSRPAQRRRPVPRALAADVLSHLQLHLQMELQASYDYFRLAVWFAERDLKGFAAFARQEALSEHQHACLVADHLIDRSQPVELATLEPNTDTWDSVEAATRFIFDNEVAVTASAQQIYSMAERAGDYITSVFLDGIIQQQTDSEAQAAYMMSRVRLAGEDAAALLLVDQELSRGDDDRPRLAKDGDG